MPEDVVLILQGFFWDPAVMTPDEYEEDLEHAILESVKRDMTRRGVIPPLTHNPEVN